MPKTRSEYFGKIDIGPFEAEIMCSREGTWFFKPYYNHNPKDTAAVHMNAMIRDMGRIWTPVPEDEVEKLQGELRRLGRMK